MTFAEFNESRHSWKVGWLAEFTPYPVKDIFPDEVVKMNFYYCVWLGIYSVWLIIRGSKENVLSITIVGNVFVARQAMSPISIPLMDFAMIHWIQRKLI